MSHESINFVSIVGVVYRPWPGVPALQNMVSTHYEPMYVAMIPDGKGSIEQPEEGSIEFQIDDMWYYAAPFRLESPNGDKRELDKLLKCLAVARRCPVVVVENEVGRLEQPLSQRAAKKFRDNPCNIKPKPGDDMTSITQNIE